MNGWIKLHRQIIKHWIFMNPVYLKAWITILIEVNHTEKKVLIESELIACKSGQSINSLGTWVKIFGRGWTIQKVRTFFNLLKKDLMIKLEGMRKTTRLTVCNYASYQDVQQAGNKQVTSKQQAGNKQVTTNKKEKKDKNEKKEENIIPPTCEMIEIYGESRGLKIDITKFYNHYESKGWMIGKNKMKNWQAAYRTWEPKQQKIKPAMERLVR